MALWPLEVVPKPFAEINPTFHLSLSDLRKEFEVPPYSQTVELGSQIELRCHPPVGKPRPRVSPTNWCSSKFLLIGLDEGDLVYQSYSVTILNNIL